MDLFTICLPSGQEYAGYCVAFAAWETAVSHRAGAMAFTKVEALHTSTRNAPVSWMQTPAHPLTQAVQAPNKKGSLGCLSWDAR